MGFSLELFFEEIQEYLAGMPLDNCEEAIGILEKYLEEQRQYAIECGMLEE